MGGSIYSVRYKAFLTRLREARLKAGLTQIEVAQKLNQPQSYVSRCESGERRVDVELTDFAMIYKKPLTYFVDFTTENENHLKVT
ncbi:helix-turn-helix transcriptional regulator [Nostoc flagelliforme FACHB-838]|uniref:Helix-turn-helix transcriptional regulator n=1 Tax=Nostoc flagelliforme FACHB-838 TaxID=2692904 RepID=A0ABR8DNE6_9NOSO|nr:helix-turn-helix transcriptional regulator [Nostoc flagelliforme]MBD2530976.1 helix-turn-helix transcriptional regulator [Nostoc flagelliforme FACHB-838]